MMMGDEKGKKPMSFKERMEQKKAEAVADTPAAKKVAGSKAAPDGPAKTPGTEPEQQPPAQVEKEAKPPEDSEAGRVAKPIDTQQPSVVIEDSEIAREVAEETARERERQAITNLLNKHGGKIENIIEKLNSTVLDSGRRDAELGKIAELILENGYDKKWDDATAAIRAIDDPSTRAENLVKLAQKQRLGGMQDAVVKETLDEAVKSARKDKDADDSVKALIKVAKTMVEFDMKAEATNVLREAKSINQFKVRKANGKKIMKYNDSEIDKIAQEGELGEIKVPAYKKIWRYGKRAVAGAFAVIAAAWLVLEATSGITGVSPRDLLVKMGVMKEKQEEAAKIYASEESVSMLGGRVGVMGDILGTDSVNGYPTLMPPELMELRKKEKEYGKDYETLNEDKSIEGIEKQLKKEKDEKKKMELEKELEILKLGEKVKEEAFNLSKMKFSTRPIPDILAELEEAEKALGKDYATVKSEAGEEETPEKQVLKLLILELGEELDNRMKLEKLVFEEKIRRNIKPENYCGNTVVGVDTNKPEEYPTSDDKVCDIIKWNVVDGEGNLLEVTVYDDHLSCPDDCKKPGKKKVKKETTTEVTIDTGSDMTP